MINGILIGLSVGLFLTAVGVMFVWLSLKTKASSALGIYGVGIFVKTILGIASCVAVVYLTNINMVSFMLTMGTLVCISYPMTAIVLTTMMNKGNYVPVNSNN